jgi:hypothetical protein
MGNMKPTADDGALTLVLLVKNYRSQMIALLIKNGVAVNDSSSDEQIAILMGNLLKVSKSFAKDLNDFVMNPKVAEVIVGGFSQTAQYFRMSGGSYLNGSGQFGQFQDYEVPDSIGYESQYGLGTNSSSTTNDPVLNSATTNTNSGTNSGGSTTSWWSGIKENWSTYLGDTIKLIGVLDTNKANTKIANSHAIVAQAGGGTKNTTTEEVDGKGKENDGISTTTIVVLSLVGVAVLGTIIYFVTRPKN